MTEDDAKQLTVQQVSQIIANELAKYDIKVVAVITVDENMRPIIAQGVEGVDTLVEILRAIIDQIEAGNVKRPAKMPIN